MSDPRNNPGGRRGGRWRSLVVTLGALLAVTASPAAAGADSRTGRPDAGRATGTVAGTGARTTAPVSPEVSAALRGTGSTTFLVYLRERADLTAAARLGGSDDRAAEVYRRLTDTARHAQRGLLAELGARKTAHTAYWISNAVRVRGDRDLVDTIAARPEVERIEPSRSYPVVEPKPAEPVDRAGAAEAEWGLLNIGAPRVWDEFDVRGETVVVANIDTGVEYDHPALVDSYRGNRGDGGFDHDYNWYDPAAVCTDAAPCDNDGHGTHTMGTMVGDDGPENRVGVAPGARWIAAKGCESSSCSDASLLAAGQWVLAPTDRDGKNPRPDLHADIVNNSWGGGSGDRWYADTVDAWRAVGIFPSFSTGNEGPDCGTAGSPGDYPRSYAAGAYDVDNVIAEFSSRGASSVDDGIKPNIAAPGVDIRSSVPGHSYGWFSGTSMAAPHVAGTVALLWSAAPTLRGNLPATQTLLDDTAIDVDAVECGGTVDDNNTFGEGRLDAYQAVKLAPRGPVGEVGGTVTSAAGGAPVVGATVSADGRTVSTDDNGRYRFTLPAGRHQVTAASYGFVAQTVPVVVPTDGTVTQNFALAVAPTVTVSGRVADGSAHRWPLYATIAVPGRPGGPVFTDPVTGRFSFTVAGHATYQVTTTARYPGYPPVTTTLKLGWVDKTTNVALPVGADCAAPGYATAGGACAPVPGGLVVGLTTDHNTGAALNGVRVVRADYADGHPYGLSAATPEDPNLPDGLYWLFSNRVGPLQFQAGRSGYATSTGPVDVLADDVRRADFALRAGRLTVDPTGVVTHQPYGSTRTAKVTVRNTGSAPAQVTPVERIGGFDLLALPGTPLSGTPLPGTPLSGKPSAGPPLNQRKVVGASTAARPGQAVRRTGADLAPASVPGTEAEKNWQRISDLPSAAYDSAAVTWDGKVYSVGGGVGVGNARHASVYDPGADAWNRLPDLPVGRGKPSVAVADDKLYVVGGWEDDEGNWDAPPLPGVVSYDLAGGGEWQPLPGAVNPAPRAAAGTAVVGGKLYLVGGCVDAGCENSDDLVVFDLATREFSTGANYPRNVSWASCGGIDGHVYCSGGSGDEPVNDAHVYDPRTDTWSPLPAPPVPLWGSQYAAAGRLLVVNGGIAADRDEVTNRTIAFDPASGSWLDLPNSRFAQFRGAGACGAYKFGGMPEPFTPSVESERLGGLESCDDPVDVPWLAAAPATFTLAPGQSRVLTLTLTATSANTITQPGAYRAGVVLQADTPYPSPKVAVTANVAPPPNWGKIQGTVLGRPCAGAPVPVPATVQVNVVSDPGTGYTVTADEHGRYALWLPRGRYEVIVARDGWKPQTRRLPITAGVVSTVDFTLDPVRSCGNRVGGL
ncbi:S8 family serine peptidase [Micromonospora sp. NPDC050397]|uniref:S8 family serine peptidase n=1 Tax=Micromonospora sp. NPDC050397 TaxID=3364279 RepID=UPI0038507E69